MFKANRFQREHLQADKPAALTLEFHQLVEMRRKFQLSGEETSHVNAPTGTPRWNYVHFRPDLPPIAGDE